VLGVGAAAAAAAAAAAVAIYCYPGDDVRREVLYFFIVVVTIYN